MIILILLILAAAVLLVVGKRKRAQAEVRYWARIHELEAQRKSQILATAIKMEKKILYAKNGGDWKQAS